MSKLPSERQLAYLKQLGFNGEPPKSAAKVSAAIGALLKRSRVTKAKESMQKHVSEARSRLNDSVDSLWLNTKSGVRHNNFCRLYGKTIGRQCSADEGTPCGICGG